MSSGYSAQHADPTGGAARFASKVPREGDLPDIWADSQKVTLRTCGALDVNLLTPYKS